MIAYGPVPSRRLGRSVGINNIPAKICSYSCVYCQLGKTTELSDKRRTFYDPKRIFQETQARVEAARSKGESIDYLTFVPDGEPTLDANLKREIELVSQLEIPIAVLTNASLIWDTEVRDALSSSDLVSLKIDGVTEEIWRRVDRPHRSLELQKILDGIAAFSDEYEGNIITETMFLHHIDYNDEIRKIAEFLKSLKITKSYIAIPTRPPTLEWVEAAQEGVLNQAFHEFVEVLGIKRVELLIGYEGDAFSSTGNLVEDILSITAVHPMREDAVRKLLESTNSNWDAILSLIDQRKLIELRYKDNTYYMRSLPSRTS